MSAYRPKGLFTAHELNWTVLEQVDPIRRSLVTRLLVTRVNIMTWVTAAKLGRLLLSRFWTMNTCIWCIQMRLFTSEFANFSSRIGVLMLEFSFYRAMLCIRGTSHWPESVSVCLSVCVCHKSAKTAKRMITQTTPHDTPGSLVFWCQRSPRNSTGVTPYEGAECRWGGENRRLSTNNRLYLENGTR